MHVRTYTRRAFAWYQAAYRRWAHAELAADGTWPEAERHGVAGDIRADIGARYTRQAARTDAQRIVSQMFPFGR